MTLPTTQIFFVTHWHSCNSIRVPRWPRPRPTRQSIYNWLDRYLRTPTAQALRDHRGHAHVTAWDEDLLAVLLSALQQPPVHWGYRDQDWTVPLLQQHLAR